MAWYRLCMQQKFLSKIYITKFVKIKQRSTSVPCRLLDNNLVQSTSPLALHPYLYYQSTHALVSSDKLERDHGDCILDVTLVWDRFHSKLTLIHWPLKLRCSDSSLTVSPLVHSSHARTHTSVKRFGPDSTFGLICKSKAQNSSIDVVRPCTKPN